MYNMQVLQACTASANMTETTASAQYVAKLCAC